MKNYVQVKLDRADEIGQQILALCLEQCESASDRNLKKIGSLLGDFVNNLRSALNYTMRYFVEARLEPLLSKTDRKAIRRRKDFPWSDSKAEFDKKEVVKQSKIHCRPIYDYLQGLQPYYPGNEWLRHLMRISNTDKHKIINEIAGSTASAVWFANPDGSPHPVPSFFGPGGDRILVKIPEVHVHRCPCYYHPCGGFAAKGGKWVFFLIVIDKHRLGLTRFIERVPSSVRGLIEDFNALT